MFFRSPARRAEREHTMDGGEDNLFPHPRCPSRTVQTHERALGEVARRPPRSASPRRLPDLLVMPMSARRCATLWAPLSPQRGPLSPQRRGLDDGSAHRRCAWWSLVRASLMARRAGRGLCSGAMPSCAGSLKRCDRVQPGSRWRDRGNADGHRAHADAHDETAARHHREHTGSPHCPAGGDAGAPGHAPQSDAAEAILELDRGSDSRQV